MERLTREDGEESEVGSVGTGNGVYNDDEDGDDEEGYAYGMMDPRSVCACM